MRDLTVSASAPWPVTPGDSIAGAPVRYCPGLCASVLPGVTPRVQRSSYAASIRSVTPGNMVYGQATGRPATRYLAVGPLLPGVTRRPRGEHRPKSRHRVTRGNTPQGTVPETTIHQARLLPGAAGPLPQTVSFR